MKTDPLRRIGYSFLGFLAGSLALQMFLLLMDVFPALVRLMFPQSTAPISLPEIESLFLIIGIFSLIGWMIVGLPVILLLPSALVSRCHWAAIMIIGIVLGPTALFAIFLGLNSGHLDTGVFTGPAIYFWVAASLISEVAFAVYSALVRRALRTYEINNGAPSGTPQSFPAV